MHFAKDRGLNPSRKLSILKVSPNDKWPALMPCGIEMISSCMVYDGSSIRSIISSNSVSQKMLLWSRLSECLLESVYGYGHIRKERRGGTLRDSDNFLQSFRYLSRILARREPDRPREVEIYRTRIANPESTSKSSSRFLLILLRVLFYPPRLARILFRFVMSHLVSFDKSIRVPMLLIVRYPRERSVQFTIVASHSSFTHECTKLITLNSDRNSLRTCITHYLIRANMSRSLRHFHELTNVC